MTHIGIMTELYRFKGKKVIECFDEINAIAKDHGYRVNVLDPEINKDIRIDNEGDRLNVKTDANSVIQSFTIG
jgi:hypothetical protein